MEFFSTLYRVMQMSPIDIFVKLILIYILAGVIGLERAALSKPAGFRTHVLVGISAVLTVICGEKISELGGGNDFSRIPAQLLSGIGFLGAGTVLKDGFNVKGLTTAASLLSITCIGLCVGAELYLSAILATAVVYIVLKHSSFISEKVGHFNNINLQIESSNPKQCILEIQTLLDKNKIEVREMTIDDKKPNPYIYISGKHRDEINKNILLSELLAIDNVGKVQEIEELTD